MRAETPRVRIAVWAMLLSATAGCEWPGDAAKTSTVAGPSQALGAESIYAWVTHAADGQPVALGVTLPEAALAGSTKLASPRLTLALPAGVSAAPFNHVEVEWRPGDRPSPDLFEEAHLDVRFSLLTAKTRDALTDSVAAVRVPPLDLVPASYIPVPRLVPRLGAYWIDPTTPAYSSPRFSDALLYAFYNGEMVALEPKLSRRLLESRQNFTRDLKLPRRYARLGYYPTRYRVGYDPTAREYSIALEGLVLRNSGATGAAP